MVVWRVRRGDIGLRDEVCTIDTGSKGEVRVLDIRHTNNGNVRWVKGLEWALVYVNSESFVGAD